jgi:hypothetical protein
LTPSWNPELSAQIPPRNKKPRLPLLSRGLAFHRCQSNEFDFITLAKMTRTGKDSQMIDVLVSRLDGAKRTGPGRFVAICPAHDDKTPSMTVAEKEGRVIFHCFAGCDPADVLAAVGLTFADLYPERPTYTKGRRTAQFNPYDVLKALTREAGIVTLAAAQISTGYALTTADADRVRLAHERLRDAAKLMGVRNV